MATRMGLTRTGVARDEPSAVGGHSQRPRSSGMPPRALAAVAWLLLASAVALPLLVDATGRAIWAGPALVAATGLLVWAAAWMVRRKGGLDHPRDSLLLEVAAVMFPSVREFRANLVEDEERVAVNSRLVDSMDGVLRTYDLGILEDQDVGRLARGSGRHVWDLDTNSLADEVAPLVRRRCAGMLPDDVKDAPRIPPDLLPACLHILAEERENPAGAPVPLDVHRYDGPVGPEHVVVPAAVLAPLVARHPLVAQTQEFLAGGDHVSAADDYRAIIEALQQVGGYNVAALVDHLRGVQHTISANIAGVVEDFALGTLPGSSRAGLEHHLVGVAYPDLPEKAAQYVAPLVGGPLGLRSSQKATLLALLYRDRFNRPTTACWLSHKSTLVEVLPAVLDACGRWAQRDLPLQQSHVRAILAPLKEFSLTFLDQVTVSLERLWHLTEGFSAFCAEQGLPGRAPPDPGLADPFYHAVEASLPANRAELARLDNPTVAIDLLRSLARPWVDSLGVPKDADEKTAFIEVVVGAFLTRASHRLELGPCHAHWAAGTAGVVEMLAARIWQRSTVMRAGWAKQAPLAQLAGDWSIWLAEARNDLGPGLNSLLAGIHAELLRGAWPTRMQQDPTTAQPTASSEDPSVPALAHVAEEILQLQRAESELASEVHHLVVDSDVGGDRFMVTFGRVGRPLADHVDDALERVGCQQTNYTPYARLGYLPRGMARHDFCTKLEHALNISLGGKPGSPHLSRLLPHDPGTKHTAESDITLQFIGRPTRWELSAGSASPRNPRKGSMTGAVRSTSQSTDISG